MQNKQVLTAAINAFLQADFLKQQIEAEQNEKLAMAGNSATMEAVKKKYKTILQSIYRIRNNSFATLARYGKDFYMEEKDNVKYVFTYINKNKYIITEKSLRDILREDYDEVCKENLKVFGGVVTNDEFKIESDERVPNVLAKNVISTKRKDEFICDIYHLKLKDPEFDPDELAWRKQNGASLERMVRDVTLVVMPLSTKPKGKRAELLVYEIIDCKATNEHAEAFFPPGNGIMVATPVKVKKNFKGTWKDLHSINVTGVWKNGKLETSVLCIGDNSQELLVEQKIEHIVPRTLPEETLNKLTIEGNDFYVFPSSYENKINGTTRCCFVYQIINQGQVKVKCQYQQPNQDFIKEINGKKYKIYGYWENEVFKASFMAV